MAKTKRLPSRDKVKEADTWDLSSLFGGPDAWERAFRKWEKQIAGYEPFRGRLSESAKSLAECIAFDHDFNRHGDRLAIYAYLRTTEDQANDEAQTRLGRFQSVSVRAHQAASFIQPEVMAISTAKMKRFLASPELAPYKLELERMLRFKPYTLSEREESLLAMQGEMAQAAGKTFRQLLDADLKFGFVADAKGEQVELGNSTFQQFLQSPDRNVRRSAFHQYYAQFQSHENTLAATLAGSIHKDVYYARARGYKSAREAAMFPDNIPVSVYDNLIAAVRRKLPAVHQYYEVRRRKMKLRDIHHYDTYVPILSDLEKRHSWDQAVKLIMAALQPLGTEYCGVLEKGLTADRWCDRYPNQGKQSGAFSYGSFDGAPYIMMNYKPDVLNDVYTLAHEAGHSMHSYLSSHSQPYQYHNYTIFVAEVASTFNEQLLTDYMLDRAGDARERAYLINRELDDMRGTIIRQTMFAEFEKVTHEMAEAGEALTVRAFKDAYRKLLEAYFGPAFAIDDSLALECFRIPHFYRAFYVYKYATGMSASIALADRVLNGKERELAAYLDFLRGGCSKDPLDLLRGAGVDMERPEPVETALTKFEQRVAELDRLI